MLTMIHYNYVHVNFFHARDTTMTGLVNAETYSLSLPFEYLKNLEKCAHKRAANQSAMRFVPPSLSLLIYTPSVRWV